jgi:pyrophosphatase PpaX
MTALLFDLDGTVVDSLPSILHTARLALDDLGRSDISDEQVRSLIGVPILETGEILLGAGQGPAYAQSYQKFFTDVGYTGLRCFNGLPELLAELQTNGAQLACVTSKRRNATKLTLEGCGLSDTFKAVVTAEDCTNPKPDPEPAYLALEQLQTPASKQVVFIGDSRFDIACGQAAGLTTCAVTWGAGTKEELANADYIADDVGQLREILLELL